MANILLTIDVEDWFQVENFKEYIPFSSWSSRELRVEKNTHRLLDLFDSVELQHPNIPASRHQAPCHPRATFFILGWLAERLPALVREIIDRGHEVASHGYHHNLCNELTPEDLKQDLTKSKELLEDIIGEPVLGYRAPNFSISDDALKIIQDCGYLYDSSYNSFAMHARYGKLNLSSNGTQNIAIQETQNSEAPNLHNSAKSVDQHMSFYELPISNLMLQIRNSKLIFPLGGGGYFRLIPFPLFITGVNSIIKKTNGYVFYIHPWEIDPEQPRVKNASASYKFRHYINIRGTQQKLLKLIKKLQRHRFVSCRQYINKLQTS